MQKSKHNIFSKLAESDNYFIVNPLSGNADILVPDEAQRYLANQISDIQSYIDNGYIVDPIEEEKLFRKKYLDFIDERDNDEVQLFFVPWYTCNFKCSYCFQDEYTNPDETVKDEVVDAFFSYIDNKFAGRRKYITIFGGEPFLNTPTRKATIEKIVQHANTRNLDVAVVTNGYHIVDFIDILKAARIREIQVTVDGTRQVHNARRMLRSGKGSFDNISQGIDLLLQNNIPVNLRVIIDKDNIDNLPHLADYAISQGWTQNPLFKTGLGRNYELHHCQTNNDRLFTRIEMYQRIYDIVKANPRIVEFHKPAFSIAKFIFENGELPNPLFDSCSGAKTEWAFDYSGRIYSCTATVGNVGDELGTFYPRIYLNENLISEWENRDVLSIAECAACSVRLACGGGCAAVARNRCGKIQSPDCRPIKELLELGLSLYQNIT